MIEQSRKLIDTFGKLDPGPECWQFIQKHKPELWQDHTEAIRGSDLTRAATTFKDMLTVWNNRNSLTQGVLI